MSRQRDVEVAALFLRLGLTAFGGPAAHVGLMHDEVVVRRKWVSEERFLDLLGATNLIPGPNSTEMAIHLGFVRAGWVGFIAAGACFVLPATFIVLGLAWSYVRFGTMPQAAWLLDGVKPVVLAIIIQALWNLGRKALKNRLAFGVGLVALLLSLLGVHELALLAAGGLIISLWRNRGRLLTGAVPAFLPLLALNLPVLATPFSLGTLFLTFLKIGSVLYGSGYVLLAFMQADLVNRLGWLTQGQLLDAIAIGQVTPGPLFTSATFVGYVLGGIPGAFLATLGMFLPAFVFVAISNPLIPRLRASAWAGPLLDGVNAASLGLMGAVTLVIGREALRDLPSVALAVASAVLLLRYRVNSIWLVLGGAAVGFALGFVRL